MASALNGKQAVVIGAGMAGLTAAGALADRFDQVVVLERGRLRSEPAYRAGTPQARHVHALLVSGQRALSELFPGFEQDLAQAGAVPLRAGLDVRIERQGYHPFPQRDLGWISYAVSRPTIERAVRARVEGRANTTLRQRCRVQEVLASPDGDAVHRQRDRHHNGPREPLGGALPRQSCPRPRAMRVDGVARYGFAESVWRHFERLDVFHRGLLPIGDAICRFNPVYGQGMSVAALEACLLRGLLERLGDGDPIVGLAPAFFAEVQALIETPWSVAILDFVFPDTKGPRPADFETTLP